MSLFRYRVESEAVEIHASAESVWEILTDGAKYGEWNPFTTRVDTDFRIGSKVELQVRLGPLNLRQQERILQVDPPRLLAWGMTMGHRLLLSARREQRIQPVSGSRCRYVTTDELSGLLTLKVALLFGRAIRNGFNAMALALKERAESVPGE